MKNGIMHLLFNEVEKIFKRDNEIAKLCFVEVKELY